MFKPARLKLVVCSLFSAVSLFGQAENGEILGTIHDPAGGTISQASITLLNQGTGIEAKTGTDTAGNYNFLNVRTGLYTVTAEAPGFSKTSTKDVQLVVNARQRVDLTLQVGEVSQSVEVTGAAS